ncbi:hypothetical protein RchiOBHm_Chr1g0343611 [Rosa chinensis]|uniref:Uncharacterized protein n=1 Tax=Rosa chinensis TaxID=74649 RepID=A0A2P6SEC5_ROSCH|nr:hypothetical protein RchiOBHm_Chr1g0343611 [Rosa chinensis]
MMDAHGYASSPLALLELELLFDGEKRGEYIGARLGFSKQSEFST